MTNVLLIFGTRPEAIKMAPVLRALQARPDRFRARVCVTAQHREMLDSVLRLFGIVADYDLAVMVPNQGLGELTARCITGLGEVIRTDRPDLVLVQGDTTTTFAASLAAYYERVAVGHIEAGLRTGNKFHPFPEEVNRKLTTQIADFHFAPTVRARANLLADGVAAERIVVTGNTVIDALLSVAAEQARPEATARWMNFFAERGAPLRPDRRFVLVTGHRRESFGEGFENICAALGEIAASNPGVDILYPVHLNPRVQEPVRRTLGAVPNVVLMEPLEYEPFVFLMSRAALILTDSGGVQEEAPSFGVPILVMRETTERPEGVDAGVVRLVGTSRERIAAEANAILQTPGSWTGGQVANPYGDGTAATQIVAALERHGSSVPEPAIAAC